MKCLCVSAMEFIYPDLHEYRSGTDRFDLHAARGSYACGQLLLGGLPGDQAPVTVALTGDLRELACEWYEMVPVHVEGNPGLTKENAVPHCPNRWAPFDLYDCVKPLEPALSPRQGTAALYFAFPVPREAQPGARHGTMRIAVSGQSVEVPVTMAVYPATVPATESLRLILGFSSEQVAQQHQVEPGSTEHQALEVAYLKLLRRMRQNMLYIGGVATTHDGQGAYAFDFTELERNVRFAQSLGFRYFQMASVGGRRSWHESTILVGPEQLPAMSYEAYRYLSQYLPALRRFLLERGWISCFTLGVADEPNEANATEFRALCGLVRKLIPEIRLLDAVSFVPIHGALDVWVPLNAEYDKYQAEFESFRGSHDELWHYVCCGPRSEGYINRFMDYPLLATRYLFWGNYRYNLTGHLHWAANKYQPGQDPFTLNCPEHHNADAQCILPPGDTHVLYPGQGAPWMSVRLEAQRASAEDYELLAGLAKVDKAAADALCARGFRSFKDVEYDPVAFTAIHRQLLETVSRHG
ncbi:MAG: DUF4091 domain-containing protein [Candidatus Latescibacterota bacterium]|jgi:hypothetical protein